MAKRAKRRLKNRILTKQKKLTRDKYLTTKELNSLLSAVSRGSSIIKAPAGRILRDWMLLFTSAALGVRPIELVRLAVESFRGLDNGIVLVETAKQKRTLVREVRVDQEHVPIFKRYLAQQGESSGIEYIFRGHYDEPLSTRTLRKIFLRYARKAGLRSGISAYSLRHYRGLVLWEASEHDLAEVGEQLGHRNPTSTFIYVKMAGKKLNDLAKRAGKVVIE